MQLIEGIKVTNLNQIHDERGSIMHMLKSTDPHYIKFGEIYFSLIHYQAIKAWHIHKSMTLNYATVHGKIKFVVFTVIEIYIFFNLVKRMKISIALGGLYCISFIWMSIYPNRLRDNY